MNNSSSRDVSLYVCIAPPLNPKEDISRQYKIEGGNYLSVAVGDIERVYSQKFPMTLLYIDSSFEYEISKITVQRSIWSYRSTGMLFPRFSVLMCWFICVCIESLLWKSIKANDSRAIQKEVLVQYCVWCLCEPSSWKRNWNRVVCLYLSTTRNPPPLEIQVTLRFTSMSWSNISQH